MSAGAARRTSADGVALPDALDHKVVLSLPLIKQKLGGLPEEFNRILNAEKSSQALDQKASALTRAEWFSVGAPEADAVGLRLTYGRVSYIQLAYNHKSDARLASIKDHLKTLGARPTSTGLRLLLNKFPIDVFIDEGDVSASISLKVQPAAWYLAYHDVTPEVADAMRHQQLLVAMTEEQALATMDGIHHTLVDKDGVRTYKWELARGHAPVSSSGKPKKTKADRTVTVTFVSGVATAVHETDRE